MNSVSKLSTRTSRETASHRCFVGDTHPTEECRSLDRSSSDDTTVSESKRLDGGATTCSSNLQQLIPVLNRLQDVVVSVGVLTSNSGHTDLDLPQVAVVGCQSVGKSSVLESLVGRDFLPRGTGIVTRCPLILQLRQVNATDGTWAQFGHTDRKFTDFNRVRDEIQNETNRKTPETALSPDPILLKIYSPDVIDLTLIDLPGITKVPVGKQPPDIEIRVRSMILQFIKKPSCIILAVTAANTDLANSDALKLAREVDPQGTRTLGVITKCDIMDSGTDALDMLMGRIYPLERGYVGVVCRNQQQINDRVSLRAAIAAENEFFRSHPAYKPIARRCGTQYLSILLNQMLMHHIKETLPDLKQRIQVALFETEQELKSYGQDPSDPKRSRGPILLEIFARFSRRFQDAIDGRLPDIHTSTALAGGARLNYIFHDWFGKALSKFNPLESLSLIEIRTAIRNATGPKAKVFVPEGAFEMLTRAQIEKLRQPSLLCVEQVYEELQRIVEFCEVEELSRYPCLKKRILAVARDVLRACLEPTNQMIENLIQMELAYCNTNHPDFVDVTDLLDSIDNDDASVDGTTAKKAPTKLAAAVSPNVKEPQYSCSSLRSQLGTAPPMPEQCDDSGSWSGAPSSQMLTLGGKGTSVYCSSSVCLPHVPAVVAPPLDVSAREMSEIQLVKRLITSYFNIVRKNIADYVPKAIMSFMVNTSKEVIQRELTTQLYKEEAFEELLSEGQEILEARRACSARLEGLRTALQVVNELRNVDLDD